MKYSYIKSRFLRAIYCTNSGIYSAGPGKRFYVKLRNFTKMYKVNLRKKSNFHFLFIEVKKRPKI